MIKIDDIINAEFSRSFMGYDMKEVDSFLDAVIEQMESNEKERREMLTALEYLLHEIEQYEQLAADGERTDGNGRHASKRETQRAAELLRIAQETESPAAQSRAETAGTEAPGAARVLKGMPRAGRQRTMHVRPEPENAVAMPDEPAQTADGEEIPTYTFAGLFADAAEEQEDERIFVAEEYEIDEASPESQEPSKTEQPEEMPSANDTETEEEAAFVPRVSEILRTAAEERAEAERSDGDGERTQQHETLETEATDAEKPAAETQQI